MAARPISSSLRRRDLVVAAEVGGHLADKPLRPLVGARSPVEVGKRQKPGLEARQP